MDAESKPKRRGVDHTACPSNPNISKLDRCVVAPRARLSVLVPVVRT